MSDNHLEGQYLTFRLNSQVYGMPIGTVREIIQVCDITAVPNTSKCVQGVINLRGKVIPVVNLRVRFDLAERAFDKETCIIVIDGLEGLIGAIVDNVCSVADFSQDQIEVVHNMTSGEDIGWILGMAKDEHRVTILVDIVKAITKANLSQVTQLAEAMGAGTKAAA